MWQDTSHVTDDEKKQLLLDQMPRLSMTSKELNRGTE